MEYLIVSKNELPMALLLAADPAKEMIFSYLEDSWCFAAREQDEIIGACVVKIVANNTAEICNISICANYQRNGIGSRLLKFVLFSLKTRQISRVELGTGTFGHQLKFYQRVGFRVDSVVKNYFLINYPEPIFEEGIQHRDMLRLSLNLKDYPDDNPVEKDEIRELQSI